MRGRGPGGGGQSARSRVCPTRLGPALPKGGTCRHLVREGGLEPPRPKATAPKAAAAAITPLPLAAPVWPAGSRGAARLHAARSQHAPGAAAAPVVRARRVAEAGAPCIRAGLRPGGLGGDVELAQQPVDVPGGLHVVPSELDRPVRSYHHSRADDAHTRPPVTASSRPTPRMPEAPHGRGRTAAQNSAPARRGSGPAPAGRRGTRRGRRRPSG